MFDSYGTPLPVADLEPNEAAAIAAFEAMVWPVVLTCPKYAAECFESEWWQIEGARTLRQGDGVLCRAAGGHGHFRGAALHRGGMCGPEGTIPHTLP